MHGLIHMQAQFLLLIFLAMHTVLKYIWFGSVTEGIRITFCHQRRTALMVIQHAVAILSLKLFLYMLHAGNTLDIDVH